MKDTLKNFDDADVEIISRSLAHDGFLRVEQIQLRHRLFAGGWSEVFSRELQLRHPAVGVLLFDPLKDTVVLVRQFRIGMYDEDTCAWPLEIVAGMVGEDEALEDVAKRESKEESNCVPSDLIKICEYYSSPGGTNEKITIYCGRIDSSDAGGIFGLEDEHEDIRVELLSFEEVLNKLEAGQIDNAMTLVALQWLQLNHEKVLKSWE